MLVEAVGPLEERVGAGDTSQAVEAGLVKDTLQEHLGLEGHRGVLCAVSHGICVLFMFCVN